MTSPFSFSGTLRVESSSASVDTARASVERALRDANVGSLQVGQATITFRGVGRAWWSFWNVGPVSSAEIAFLATEGGVTVNYRYSWFGQFALWTGVILLLGALAFSGSPDIPFLALFMFPAMWLWVVGGRCVIARERFPRFLARTVGAHVPPLRRTDVADPFPEY